VKLLLLFAILYIAYSVWRSGRIEERQSGRAPQGHAGPQEMVECPVCGVHLPRLDAVRGARGIHYCSNEHRLRAGG
jgi:uncharacterized protein